MTGDQPAQRTASPGFAGARSTAAAVRSEIGGVLRAGLGLLSDLVSRIVNGIAGVSAVVVLGTGCSGPKVEKSAPAPAAVALARPAETSDEPKPLGRFDLTFYYVIGEDEVGRKKPANENVAKDSAGRPHGGDAEAGKADLAAIAPVDTVTIYDGKSCAPIADVTKEFAAQLALQGTGKLRDGRVVNIFGACPCDRQPCFKVTDTKWGTAGNGRPLQPFRTVAVDRKLIPVGSLLYVPALEGRTMPGRAPWGGFVHDGCLVADDTGGGIIGKQLDLFVGRRAYHGGLANHGGSHAWARHIPVYDGSKICQRKGRKISRKAGGV